MVRLYLGVGILFVSLILIACGGAEEAQPTSTPTADVQAPTPEPTPTPEAAAPEPAVLTLAFIDDGDIWLVNADGSNERRITDFGGTDRQVVHLQWLASGQEIAYEVSLRLEPGTASPSTFTSVLANADGMVLWERELPQFAGVFWSPDGQLVAILPDKGPARIEDRAGQSVWTGNGGEGSGSWSADGSHFAIVEGNEIVVVSRDGISVSRLDVGPPLDVSSKEGGCNGTEFGPGTRVFGRPVFAPDGETVLVAAGCSILAGATGNIPADIYEASLDGAVSREIRGSEIGGLRKPSFSPDGSRIAVVSFWKGGCAGAERDLFSVVVDLETGPGPELIPHEISEAADAIGEGRASAALDAFFAGWSPVGDAILVPASAENLCGAHDREPLEPPFRVEGTYLMRVDGLAEEKIRDRFLGDAVWSPSGRLIAYGARGFLPLHRPEGPDVGRVEVLDIVTGKTIDLGPGQSPAWRPLAPDAATLPWEGAVTDNLRIRSEANTASDTVGTLPKGTKVRVYGEAQGEEAEPGSGNRLVQGHRRLGVFGVRGALGAVLAAA